MGRWTLSHYDNVLRAKMKSLVDGAVKRAKLEKSEPTISYELFVEELDAGDSFTTSLIDILVNEMAERRTRPTSTDRRLIADRSAKSLRMLAAPLRIYRDRSAVHEEVEMEEDEAEFDNALENAASAVEGARLNTEMYDAFGGFSHHWSSHLDFATWRRSQPDHPSVVASTLSDDTQVANTLPSAAPSSTTPTNRTNPMHFLPSNPLFRSTTVRRPTRPRTVDFSDFTSRRRSSIRQGTQEVPVPRIDVATEDMSRSLSPWERLPGPPTSSRSPQPARRFFGPTRHRRHDSGGSLLFRDIALPSASSWDADDPSYWTAGSGPWFSSRQTRYQAQESEGNDERNQGDTPRLRRGGVRAPESILPGDTSPSPENAPIITFAAPLGSEDTGETPEN